MFDGKGCVGDIQNNIGMSKEARDLSGWKAMCRSGRTPCLEACPPFKSRARRGHRPETVWKTFRALMPMEVATLFVAMISAYVLGLCLGLSPWILLALGIGFGLSSVNILLRRATPQVRAIATMPGVVAGTVGLPGQAWRGAGGGVVCGCIWTPTTSR